jgi:hypothetical protein
MHASCKCMHYMVFYSGTGMLLNKLFETVQREEEEVSTGALNISYTHDHRTKAD